MELSKKSRKGKERREKKRCKEERKRLHWLWYTPEATDCRAILLAWATKHLVSKRRKEGKGIYSKLTGSKHTYPRPWSPVTRACMRSSIVLITLAGMEAISDDFISEQQVVCETKQRLLTKPSSSGARGAHLQSQALSG